MLRSAFGGGPAYLTWNGLTLQMHEDWQAIPETNTTDRKTNLQGTVGRGINYIIVKITAKPIATSTNLADLIAKLHPYKSSDRGRLLSEILGGSDLPAIIQARDGRSITFAAALLTKEPEVTFAPNVDLFGDFELTCLIADDGSSTDITDLVTEAASAYTEPTLNPLTIISDRYVLAWGATAPFDDIDTDESGIKLVPSLSLKDCMTQRDGLLNYRIEDKTATVQFTPVSLSSQDFSDLIPAVGRGKLLGTFGQELTVEQVTGTGGPKVVVPLASPTASPARFGQESRIGEVTMMCERKFATTLQEPYTLSVKSA